MRKGEGEKGLAVRFREKSETGEVLFRATGRATSGVTGMRFKRKGDFLQAIEVVDHEKKFLVASEAGLGVRTRFEDYRLINRGGSGVTAINLPADGSVALIGALGVRDTDEIMLLTSKGQSVRCPINTVRETNRGAKGVKLLTLSGKDSLLSIAKVVESDEELEAAAAALDPTLEADGLPVAESAIEPTVPEIDDDATDSDAPKSSEN